MIAFQDARHELCFSFRVRLTIVPALLCQPTFQVLVSLRKPIVAAKCVAESDLLAPPWVPGLDQLQMRLASLSRRIRLDEKAPPWPAIQVRRHRAPAVRDKSPRRLGNRGFQVRHGGDQVDDRFGGKPRNSRRPNVLDSINQPRLQQTDQLLAFSPRPDRPLRIVRAHRCPLICPRRDVRAHQMTVTRLCDSRRSVAETAFA